ncbi:MAG: cation:proton antiporter [Actinomycetota bacterium]|nr:cation:proton antiporter [Actinomycetota bacterium]
MVAVLVFSVTLLTAVLLSALAHRSVVSTAVLFLLVGAAFGSLGADVVHVQVADPVVREFALLALFSILFSDGMRLKVSDLKGAGRLAGRALLIGLPLTMAATAMLARVVVGLPWAESLLLGAVLSPTDPVFAAAIVGREEIPGRLRQLLNVESGLNDGLALPVVVVLLATVGHRHVDVATLVGDLVLGVAIGVSVPAVAVWLEKRSVFGATAQYQPLGALAVGLIVLAGCSITGGNEFLGAFSAGITVATLSPAGAEAFHHFGELVSELLKLAAVMVFAAVVSPAIVSAVSAWGWVFAALALFVARPVALELAMVASPLAWEERAVAAWFGPTGFASVVYGLLVLEAGSPRSAVLFALVAVVVAASIVAHSSTDVLVAHWYARRRPRPEPDLGAKP